MAILVPIDDSEPATKAIEHAAETYAGEKLLFLHVISPTASMYGEGAAWVYEDVLESRKNAAEKLFDEAEAIAAEHGCSVDTKTVVGRPAREIVSFAEKSGVDGVVIGSHGRSGASRVLLGSVAEMVVRRSPVPVTVVR